MKQMSDKFDKFLENKPIHDFSRPVYNKKNFIERTAILQTIVFSLN